MMFCLIFLVAYTSADNILQKALSSPQHMAGLFSTFQSEHNRNYVGKDAEVRLRLFQRNVRYVASQNQRHLSWNSGLNEFSDKSEAEKKAYLGKSGNSTINIVREEPVLSAIGVPSSVSWIEQGGVTLIKNQASCGSCWSFGAMGTLENHYQQVTGVLRSFSDQDVLDCTYQYNGCNGGVEWTAINRIVSRGNKLFSAKDHPYVAYDGACKSKAGKNALRGAKIVKYIHVAKGESSAIAAMSKGAVAVSIKVISSFYSYKTGIYADNHRSNYPNHVLTGVAYTPTYIVVKNSWGGSWGDKGYIKVARNWDGCAFHRDTGYPLMKITGNSDNVPADKASTYDPESGNDNGGDDGDGDCPSGTKLCADGVCRHEHMC